MLSVCKYSISFFGVLFVFWGLGEVEYLSYANVLKTDGSYILPVICGILEC